MVDLWVMNDFADNKKLAIFENLARCIGKIDRALDPVAKAELLCQAHGGIAHGNDSTRPADFIDNVAAVVRFDLLLHRGHHIRRAEIYFLARGRAAGNQVSTHIVLVIPSEVEGSRGATHWQDNGTSRLRSTWQRCVQRCFASLN